MSSSSTTSSASSDDSDNEPSDDDNEEEEQEAEPATKMSPYHAKNYFNSTMGGKDLRVLFGMAIGCHTRNLPDHKDPPFSKSKAYHSEVKPDSATLKLEVVRRWKAYTPTGHQPRPSNWKIDKCIDYLMTNPIPTLEEADLDWLESKLDEWKGIQVTINESQQHADDRILHRSWTSDIPFLRLYHTLVEDGIRSAFGKAYNAKTCEELDGRNTALFQDFYELAATQFNNGNWIPNSLVVPDLHEDFRSSKPLPLNVAPITADQFKKKLNDNRYKMVKLISDWERSGAGAGMVNDMIDEDDNSHRTTQQYEYEFLDGDDRKSFLRERPAHVLYLWHLAHKYGILRTVRQQLEGGSSVDGSNVPKVDTTRNKKRKHSPESCECSLSESVNITKNMEQIANSINGLVGVARQSQETQQINMLHRRREKLEEAIQTLDSACMELELNLLESTGTRKQVFERVFNKKKAELDDKKTELQQIAHTIHNQENKNTSTPNAMPSFICVDGSGSGRSADNNNE